MFTQKSSSKAPPETHLTADISVRYHLTIAGSTHVRHRLYDPDLSSLKLSCSIAIP